MHLILAYTVLLEHCSSQTQHPRTENWHLGAGFSRTGVVIWWPAQIFLDAYTSKKCGGRL